MKNLEGAGEKQTSESVLYDDWMSDADALMWHIERDPLLRSTALSVWVLDQPPDRERMRATLERTLRNVPRLGQRVVEDPLGVAAPRWETDPLFDLGYHVRRLRVAGDGGMRELLDYAAPVGMQAFDKDRPLWELHCVEGMQGGRYGLVFKVHHAMSDGIGMVRMMSGMIETSREDEATARGARKRESRPVSFADGHDDPEPGGEIAHLGDAVMHRASVALERSRRAAAAFGRGISHFAGHPLSTAGDVVETLESLARLVRPVSEPMSPIWRRRSLGLRLDVLEFPLVDLKRATAAAGGTLNDVFVAAVAGGLSRYHMTVGRPARQLRMTMPINVRRGRKGAYAGNQFVPARFAVPMDVLDPRQRVRAIHDIVRSQRDEPALAFIEEISAAINVLGEAASTRVTGAMMKAVDFVTSDVAGPSFPIFMSGARIERMFPFGPTAGAAVNVTLFSYDGVVHIGINSNLGAVADGGLLRASLEESFAEVLGIR
ncbi:MAG: DUF1298 domain-containing protein [Deltaproteobacteria bacterium]|nr:DUF1298 domain-containing protein [Deltaproteobacteria bacterium]